MPASSAFHLLVWREVFPWIGAYQAGGLDKVDWFVPILFMLTAATPSHRKHPSWFLSCLATSFFFYAEYKNPLSRVAQIKEGLKERA